jgi:predicted nucleic acid-binding Zn ribbon protein
VPHSRGFERRKDPRTGDPVSIGQIVDSLMDEEVFSRGMPIAELTAAWPSVVGERLAAESSPIALEDGVLTLGVTNGPWGAQVKFLHAEILRKADEKLGGDTVRSLRIVVRSS